MWENWPFPFNIIALLFLRQPGSFVRIIVSLRQNPFCTSFSGALCPLVSLDSSVQLPASPSAVSSLCSFLSSSKWPPRFYREKSRNVILSFPCEWAFSKRVQRHWMAGFMGVQPTQGPHSARGLIKEPIRPNHNTLPYIKLRRMDI